MTYGDIMNESIGRSMSIIYRYRQILINHKLKPYDLGCGQYIFLMNIARNLGISQKELTSLVMIDKATTAKALKKLEENDYIYRVCDLADRRYNQLFLTDKGHELVPIIIDILEGITEELTHGLSDDECEQFSAISNMILDNAILAVDLLRNEK